MFMSFCDYSNRLQIIDRKSDGSCEVYNFRDASDDDQRHSHIHYYPDGSKYAYRTLENAEFHNFLNKEMFADCAVMVPVLPYEFESNRIILNDLSVEELLVLREYLKTMKCDDNLTYSRK